MEKILDEQQLNDDKQRQFKARDTSWSSLFGWMLSINCGVWSHYLIATIWKALNKTMKPKE